MCNIDDVPPRFISSKNICWYGCNFPPRFDTVRPMDQETAENTTAIEVLPPLDEVFRSVETVNAALAKAGYFTDEKTANTVWLAYHLGKPILQEGPAGAGKTQLALSTAKIAGMKIVRLQCYPGIDSDMAIGHYDHALQQLFTLLHKDRDMDAVAIKREIYAREFFITGPLLEAIESPNRVVLLIDEVDKVPEPFEAMLLELLAEWEISSPMLGTVKAVTKPLTFLTSNKVRDLSDALRRRSFYLFINHPTAMLEGRIVAAKTPSLPLETHVFIAMLAQTLRIYTMKKPPSISEMSDIAQAMALMGLKRILPEQRDVFAPLFAKWPQDIETLNKSEFFGSIIRQTNDYVDRVKLMLAVKRRMVKPEILSWPKERVREAEEIQGMLNRLDLGGYPEEEIARCDRELKELRKGH